MTAECPACGTSFGEEDACPQCGLPVAPPDPDTPLTPAMSAPQPDVASPSPKKPMNRKRVLTVVGIGALALALVATVSFGAMALFAPGGPFGGPVQLKVTGQPMSTAGHWANGVKETWRVSGAHSDDRDAGTLDPLSLASGGWVFSDLEGDITASNWAFDPQTGKSLWNSSGYNGMNLSCARDELAGALACVQGTTNSIVLLDPHTGKAKNKRPLSGLGLRPTNFYTSDIAVVAGEIVVVLYLYPSAQLPDYGDFDGLIVARIPADLSSARWQTRLSGCESDDWKAETSLRDDVEFAHGVVFMNHGVAVDFNSGKPIVDSGACVAPVSDTSIYAESRSGKPIPRQVPAPDGVTLAVTNQPSTLSPTASLSPVALRSFGFNPTETGEGGSKIGLVSVIAYDPVTGKDLWAKPIQVTGEEAAGKLDAGMVAFDGTRLIFGGLDQTVAVDPATGAVLWSSSESGIVMKLSEDGTLLTCGAGEMSLGDCSLRSSVTGAEYVDLDTSPYSSLDAVEFAPNERGSQSLMVLVDRGEDAYMVRLDPTDRPTRALSVPSGTPACPAGMTPISWTQYSDGAILLCQAADRFAVVYPTHPDWQAAQLNFTDGGHQVVFSNGVKIRVGLGGSVVYTDANGTTTSRPATTSWNNAQGQVKFALPSNIKTCPAGSWPISLSTYKGGWLQVCGVSSNQPTVIYLADGANIIEAGSVTARNGGYCGVAPIGQVCAFEAPAVVSISQNGKVTQHSASANYFDGRGAGGAGIGTGSYGVTAPSSTAKDQVRYLTQILQKSAAGRANLETAVNQVRTCTDLPGAVATMNGVVANRQQLLDALDSTPVDAIPNGAALVAQLRDALQKSHDSDLLWVKWAQAEQGNGCSDGENNPSFKQVDATLEAVASAKDIFVANWNSSIAPTYGVSKFTTSQI